MSLVQAGVVGPAVERSEPLQAGPGAPLPYFDAVGAYSVSRHPDEQRSVVARSRLTTTAARWFITSAMSRLSASTSVVVPSLALVVHLAHRVGYGRVLMQDLKIELVRPPVLVPAALDGILDVTDNRARRYQRLPCWLHKWGCSSGTAFLLGLGLSDRDHGWDRGVSDVAKSGHRT